MSQAVYLGALIASTFFIPSSNTPKTTDPIVTAEKYVEYKKASGHFNEFTPPKIILICYQQSTLKYLQEQMPDMKEHNSFSDLPADAKKLGPLGPR